MKRSDLFALIKKHGGKAKPPHELTKDRPKPHGPVPLWVVPRGKKDAIRKELLAYFRSPQGQEMLMRAPAYYDDEVAHRPDAETAVELLLEEIEEV